MFSPGTAGLGVACLVTERSAEVLTVSGADAALLPGSGSSLAEVAVAELVNSPGGVPGATMATTVIDAADPSAPGLPASRVPSEHSRTGTVWQLPRDGTALTNSRPAGSRSVTVVDAASDGPKFVASST